MVRLGEAGIAALRAFFGTKRGTRQLIESSQEKLVEYFADKGTPARQLPLDIPPPDDQEELSSWVDEWKEYAKAAGIDDVADINNVGRWIKSSEADGRPGRSGKAAAVADALTRRGLIHFGDCSEEWRRRRRVRGEMGCTLTRRRRGARRWQ